MKFGKFTVIMAVLLMAILAIGAVSAESIDDMDTSIASGDSDLGLQITDDSAGDLSAADAIDDEIVAADEDVENDLGDENLDENPSYNINDDTYSTYFEDNGTAKDILVPDEQAGDYNLVIGTLNNKNIIIDWGSQIQIMAKEGEGIINNGTIIIGDDQGNAGSVFITGLTFNNYNKDGIDVREGSTDILIDNNRFNMEYDSTFGNTSMAVATHGFVSGVTITNNIIKINSEVEYTYGIDLTYYLSFESEDEGSAGAELFNVSDNTIIIDSTAQTGMAEGIYLDTLSNSIIENNIIKVTTIGKCANYGIQLADSYAFLDFDKDIYTPSPYNVTFRGNDISLKSNDMAYGLTVISIWVWGPEMENIVKDFVISDNTISIDSAKGAMAIGTKTSDVEVTNNNIFIMADADATNAAFKDPEFGNGTAAITLVNSDATMGDYNYFNITVTGNKITTNVAPFNITKNETENQPLVVEDNTIEEITLIDDDNYSTYFNEDGTIKNDAPLSPNDTIYLGELNNKKFVIDMPLTVKGAPENKLTNTTISLVAGADGTTIESLNMFYNDDGSTVFAVIAVNDGVSDLLITGNTITTVSAPGWNYDMAISVYGSSTGSKNITISGNSITMSGSAGGLYAIDVQNYDPFWSKGKGTTGLYILDNTISILATGMVEPIYVASCNDILIDGNKISSYTTGGDAYGIGTSENNNFTVTNNEIQAVSQNNMAYGVASPDSTDVVINNNNITAIGVGAIGVGFINDENVEVDGNIISITGGDYTTVSTYEKVGKSNAAIFDRSGNSGVVIGENEITENCPLTITDANYATYFNDDGTIKDDAPISAGDLIFLGELNNKKFIIDVPLSVKGATDNKVTNTTVSLVSGADGSTVAYLNMLYEDDGSATFAVIAVNDGVSNVLIADNIINTVSASSGNYDMGISIYGSETGSKNITVSGNSITMSGDAGGLYGIDAQNYDASWTPGKSTTGLNITANVITISGSGLVEPIYLYACSDILVDGNVISSTSTGTSKGNDAYGIGAPSNDNLTITFNDINVLSKMMGFGISSTESTNLVFDNNTITVTGTGAIGIGFADDENVEVAGNDITITGGLCDSIETFDSLGTANAAIYNKSGNTNVVIGENTVVENIAIVIDDSNYDQFFDEEGKIKEGTIQENATVLFGDLTGKNMVIDIPLNISALENTKLVNTTIKLVEGADGTTIDGLDMEFTGDETSGSFAVISAFEVSDVTIMNNKIVIPDSKGNGYAMAIEVEGLVEGCDQIAIMNNIIDFKGSTKGMYGIDVFTDYYAPNALNTRIFIYENEINIEGATKTAEAIYLNKIAGTVVYNNTINVKGADGATSYGIGASSVDRAVFEENTITVNGTGMSYGISHTKSENGTHSNNTIVVEGTGAIGIGLAQDSAIGVIHNDVTSIGGDFTTVSSYDSVGVGNGAIVDRDGTNTIENNTIVEIGPKLIDDTTYSQYFDENGKMKDDSTIAAGDILYIGDLTNKKMVIDIPVDVKGLEGKKQVNTTVSLVAGADGTNITGLNMNYTDDGSATFAVIDVNDGVSDLTIADNNIYAETAPSWNYDMAISVYGSQEGSKNIAITGNNITMTGNAGGLYGIDVQNYDPYWNKLNGTTGLNISDNIVTIQGTGMTEAIYVSESKDILIDGNTIVSTSTGSDAYAIGTSGDDNITISNNEIGVGSVNNMAYGITSTYSSDVALNDNRIAAIGTGAVGIGFAVDEYVEINGNTIDIAGGDFTNVFTYDMLGTANAAILDKFESTTGLNVGENAMTENGKATDKVMTGNGTKDLQNIIDAAAAGDTVDLTGQYFMDVGTVNIDKDIAITGGKIIGAEGKAIFEVSAAPDEVNITGVDFVVNNANTVVKLVGENATDGVSTKVPAVNIKDNTIEAANDNVVTESVTVLELDSERPVLSPTNDISVSGNTIAAGVDPFDFKVTSIVSGDDIVIEPQNISVEKKATVIDYQDMTTTAVDLDTDGRVGEYFKVVLKDADGNVLSGKSVQIGFNGKIYNRTTDENGSCSLQINLVRSDIYTFAVSFIGDEQYNGSFVVAKITVNKQKGSLTVPAKSYAASAKTKSLTATFKSASGKVVAGKSITFTVNGKTYTAKTNAKGVATVKVSLNKKGTYSFTAKFAGDSTYAAISKSAKLTIK